jgi:hypothetical protein
MVFYWCTYDHKYSIAPQWMWYATSKWHMCRVISDPCVQATFVILVFDVVKVVLAYTVH